MNLPDYLLLAALAAGVWAALRAIRRGKDQCGGGCAACPMNGQCAKKKRE